MNGMELLGREVGYGTHQQATGTTTASRQPVKTGKPVLDQVVSASDEVGEGVLFGERFALLVPAAAKFAPAPDVGDGVDDAPIHQCEPGDREVWIHRRLVRPVAIQQGRC